MGCRLPDNRKGWSNSTAGYCTVQPSWSCAAGCAIVTAPFDTLVLRIPAALRSVCLLLPMWTSSCPPCSCVLALSCCACVFVPTFAPLRLQHSSLLTKPFPLHSSSVPPLFFLSASVPASEQWLLFDDTRVDAYDDRSLQEDCFGGRRDCSEEAEGGVRGTEGEEMAAMGWVAAGRGVRIRRRLLP